MDQIIKIELTKIKEVFFWWCWCKKLMRNSFSFLFFFWNYFLLNGVAFYNLNRLKSYWKTVARSINSWNFSRVDKHNRDFHGYHFIISMFISHDWTNPRHRKKLNNTFKFMNSTDSEKKIVERPRADFYSTDI